jgi:hypothetical protein
LTSGDLWNSVVTGSLILLMLICTVIVILGAAMKILLKPQTPAPAAILQPVGAG